MNTTTETTPTASLETASIMEDLKIGTRVNKAKAEKANPVKTINAIIALLESLPNQISDLKSEAGNLRSRYGSKTPTTTYLPGSKKAGTAGRQADVYDITLPDNVSDKVKLTLALSTKLLGRGEPKLLAPLRSLLDEVSKWEAIKASK